MNHSRTHRFLEPYLRRWMRRPTTKEPDTHRTKEKSLTFVVVEDDELIKDSVVADLRERGYQAEGTSAVPPVPHLLEKMGPTVLAVDYYLGEDNGVALYDELVTKKVMHDSVFVLISAYPKVAELAKMRGIPYLEKPFSVDDLITKALAAASYHRDEEKGKTTQLLGEIKNLFTTDL